MGPLGELRWSRGRWPYRIGASASGRDGRCCPIRRVSDGAFIPADEQNADYRDYLAWIAGGNALPPAADPEPVRERTPAEKLVAAGLTVAELKTLLGLQ